MQNRANTMPNPKAESKFTISIIEFAIYFPTWQSSHILDACLVKLLVLRWHVIQFVIIALNFKFTFTGRCGYTHMNMILLLQPLLPPLASSVFIFVAPFSLSLFYKSHEFKYVIWLIHKLRYHVEALFIRSVVHNLFFTFIIPFIYIYSTRFFSTSAKYCHFFSCWCVALILFLLSLLYESGTFDMKWNEFLVYSKKVVCNNHK